MDGLQRILEQMGPDYMDDSELRHWMPPIDLQIKLSLDSC